MGRRAGRTKPSIIFLFHLFPSESAKELFGARGSRSAELDFFACAAIAALTAALIGIAPTIKGDVFVKAHGRLFGEVAPLAFRGVVLVRLVALITDGFKPVSTQFSKLVCEPVAHCAAIGHLSYPQESVNVCPARNRALASFYS